MLTVCNYHYIREDFDAKFPSIFGVKPFEFKNQLLKLKEEGEFVSSDNIIKNIDDILNSSDNFILISFDDGLKEQYDIAFPILQELQLPAVFFANSRNFQDGKVSTVHKIHLLRSIISTIEIYKILISFKNIKFTENDQLKAKSTYKYDEFEVANLKYLLNFKIPFNELEKIISAIFETYFDENNILERFYMDKNQLVSLSKLGYLGSHTHSHYPIGLLSKKQIEFEIKNAKEYFEKLTQTKIESLSYPYGTAEACNINVANIAKKVGHKIGFTTISGSNNISNNKLLLSRFDCNDLIGGKNYKNNDN